MKKREFLKVTGIMAAGSMIAPIVSCGNPQNTNNGSAQNTAISVFELPELSYGFEALEPNIDRMTMEIHHGKHHAGYVRKLNAALEGSDLAGKNMSDILASVDNTLTGIRNNAGGHFNHSLYWKVMSPDGGGSPTGDLSDAINATFGTFDSFKESFSTAAKTRFGSGWAWLSKKDNGQLFVSSTPNQDNPLMTNLVEENGTPILGIDVWEHAYYLKYQNKRAEYIENFFNLIDWDEVGRRLVG